MSGVQILAFGTPAPAEWLVILIIGLLLFGRRLPAVMRGLGSGVRAFRSGLSGHLDGADITRTRHPDAFDQRPGMPGSVASDTGAVATDGEADRPHHQKPLEAH